MSDRLSRGIGIHPPRVFLLPLIQTRQTRRDNARRPAGEFWRSASHFAALSPDDTILVTGPIRKAEAFSRFL